MCIRINLELELHPEVPYGQPVCNPIGGRMGSSTQDFLKRVSSFRGAPVGKSG